QPITPVAIGSPEDVDVAVAAAKRAFETFSRTTVEERLALLDAVIEAYQARAADLADVLRREVGAPEWLARKAQVPTGVGHLTAARAVLAGYRFEDRDGTAVVLREPVG